MVLFYAPSWWLRIPVVCTPFTWQDTMEYIREKLGRKKKVKLPQSLTVQAPAAARRRRQEAPVWEEPEAEQTVMEMLPEAEEVPETPEETESSGAEPLT